MAVVLVEGTWVVCVSIYLSKKKKKTLRYQFLEEKKVT